MSRLYLLYINYIYWSVYNTQVHSHLCWLSNVFFNYCVEIVVCCFTWLSWCSSLSALYCHYPRVCSSVAGCGFSWVNEHVYCVFCSCCELYFALLADVWELLSVEIDFYNIWWWKCHVVNRTEQNSIIHLPYLPLGHNKRISVSVEFILLYGLNWAQKKNVFWAC